MKKQLNKIVAMLLTGVVMLTGMPVNSFAATGTDGMRGANRGTGQVALYQDGALSAAYSEGEWSEQYVTPEKGTFEGDLYWGLKNFDSEIVLDSYAIPINDAIEIYQKVINANPDLFYVSNLIQYSYDTYCNGCNGHIAQLADGNWYLWDESQGRYVSCNHSSAHTAYYALYYFVPHYIAGKSQLTTMTSRFDEAVETAMAGIDKAMSDFDKALYFHDYIIKLNSYDYKNFLNGTVPDSSHSAYGALVNHVSVCDGYALAYSYLLQKCGIKTRLVTSNDMGHAWSAVELDGEWYFVDCTGDDLIDDYTNADSSDRFDVVYHDTFLMSEDLLSNTWYSDSTYHGWAQTDIVANSTKYDDAYWRMLVDEEDNVVQWGVTNEYGYCDGYWYYVDDSTTYNIMKTDDPTKAGEVYSTLIKDAWITWGGWLNGNDELVCFGKASVYAPSKTMYVSDADKVYTIDLTGDGTAVPYLEYTGAGKIYGLTVIGDFLYIGTANDPWEKEKLSSKYLGAVKKGDTTGDGKINTADALQILKYVANLTDPGFIAEAADVDGNKKINTADALQVLKFVANLIPKL